MNTPSNEKLLLTKEMKVQLISILKNGFITEIDSNNFFKLLVDANLQDWPKQLRIVFERETDEELFERMKRQKEFLAENPQFKHLYEDEK